MTEMGLGEYCQQIQELDVDLLIKQFTDLEARGTEVRRTMDKRNAEAASELDGQFAILSSKLIRKEFR
jgi:hypothetical protein